MKLDEREIMTVLVALQVWGAIQVKARAALGDGEGGDGYLLSELELGELCDRLNVAIEGDGVVEVGEGEEGEGVWRFVDAEGNAFKTNSEVERQFIEDMEGAEIPWRLYSGRWMDGRECPAVYTSDEVSLKDVHRATEVELCQDGMGLGLVLYTG